jgi:hypothetical protein
MIPTVAAINIKITNAQTRKKALCFDQHDSSLIKTKYKS